MTESGKMVTHSSLLCSYAPLLWLIVSSWLECLWCSMTSLTCSLKPMAMGYGYTCERKEHKSLWNLAFVLWWVI